MDWSVPSRTSAHKGVEMQQWRQTASPRNTTLSLFTLSVIFFCFTRMTPPPRREERAEKPKARRQNELSENIMDFNPTRSSIRVTGVSVQRHSTSTLILFHLQTTDSWKRRTLPSESVQVLFFKGPVCKIATPRGQKGYEILILIL